MVKYNYHLHKFLYIQYFDIHLHKMPLIFSRMSLISKIWGREEWLWKNKRSELS